MKPDSLQLEESPEGIGCLDWSIPQREVQPTGFPFRHSHEVFQKASAVTPQDVARLAAEVAKLRTQFSQALAVIEGKLSLGSGSRSPKAKFVRKFQSDLPLIPAELSPIAEAIEKSKVIFTRQVGPDEDSGLECSKETWKRATKILLNHGLVIWKTANVVIRSPAISAGPDGSVDLYWTAAPYGLLLNVPADPEQPATYFGDDATNPDSNRTSGKLDSTKPTDIGILMWLAHTAEQ